MGKQMSRMPPEFDVLVIGAGMAGLISACRLAQAGKKVLLIEKLSFLGGRFSAFPYGGAEISSGAFHTFPHGSRGPMAQALRSLGIDIPISKPSVVASFSHAGKHIICKTPWQLLNVLSTPLERLKIIHMTLQVRFQKQFQGSFGDWLLWMGASPLILTIFDRFCQFALSASVHSVPYYEGKMIVKNIFDYGLPGIPLGGARHVVQQLTRTALAAGVTIWKATQVESLEFTPHSHRICGAVLYDRRKGSRMVVKTEQVISTIGPQASIALLGAANQLHSAPALPAVPPAIGLKMHVLSSKSLIPHDSIMFCLDTQRIAGILQATNADPALAPAGKHLLISHQMLPPGADAQQEQDLAVQDWQHVFGDDFKQCQVIGFSQFPERFPVNWATQGSDIRSQPYADLGFWLAGDALKPAGLMMVEGVAASAEQVSDLILSTIYPE
jgi:phytoene dehydrogenase-like protein